MQIKEIQLDEQNPNVTLTAYLLADSAETVKGKPRPAVLICPGGGYFSCSDREAEPIALQFNALGYHAFVLRYTVYQDGTLSFPDLSKPLPVKADRLYPHALRDLGRAVLTVKHHAQDWQVDPDQLVLCGFSAGGNNVGLYATNWNQPILTDYLNVTPAELKPLAVIMGYPLTDYHLIMEDLKHKADPMDLAFIKASNVALVGEAEPDDATLTKISPACQVTDQTPPCFIWTTAGDQLLSSRHSLRMAAALAAHHVPYELHVFEDGPHGLSLATQASSESRSQIKPDVAQWMTACTGWLAKRLSLHLPALSDFERMQQGLR
ncbi:alpha/beta hydrolase [Lactiplantibacillus modestisalitolerans]|uniref:Alpha/beta hydrolase n=1 Tax=Lactiplantibacillus modestisalitolerans TaxID=1457219 RepID=A0ABV5WSX1_9LACO|nr:alpha/beta hydrolase [Lactiplantibacillus modestisalitolerans]